MEVCPCGYAVYYCPDPACECYHPYSVDICPDTSCHGKCEFSHSEHICPFAEDPEGYHIPSNMVG